MIPSLYRSRLTLVQYIDDSGEETSKFTLMGGPVFAEKDFFSFHYQWDWILQSHKIEPPIHMREFLKPKSRFAHLSNGGRRALFQDLVYLINQNKLHSLTVAIDNIEFQEFFPADQFRGYMGAAALGFLWCMVLNGIIVREHKHKIYRMGYMVARSDINAQLTDAYNFLRSYEVRIEEETIGPFSIDEPSQVNALQAADMVAWANLRKHRGEDFRNGFEPLELLTRHVESDVKPGIHFHFKPSRKSTENLAAIVGSPVRRKGKRASLLGIIAPKIKADLGKINFSD
jgi:hypothetical protein